MERFVEAKLIDFKTIHVSISGANKDMNYIFTLIVKSDLRFKMDGVAIKKSDERVVYEFKLDQDLPLGYDYHVAITNIGIYPLNVNNLASLPDFDNRFAYDGDDLGATYTRKKTSFAVWAPLASQVILILDDKKHFEMKRTDKGVYRVSVDGNLKGHFYNYYVTNSGVSTKTVDPYGKASTLNSRNSVILDFNNYKINMHDKHPEKMNSYLDAIIYETHVRDITIDPSTNIVNKGKFLGLTEVNRTNKDGLPVGFDYIKSLGVTHVQLLPIYDYATVDEEHPDKSYNWGYDPIQYFVPEGSFASDLNDPSSRIKDLLALISHFHKNKIRVVMDVVFNHVYEHQHSSLEATVPNYYFRRTKEGIYFNSSGCGNDIASERKMARKLIIDVCKWWATYYHVDGFRFDLMGIIDADTINELKYTILSFRPGFMFYGEGWNMMSGYNLVLANSDNANKVQFVSFFNDFYRDVVIGKPNDHIWGYSLNSNEQHQNFKEAITGCSFNFNKPSRFNHVSCSVNFIECHDNHTLYDKMKILRPELNEEERLKRVSFANSLVLYSLGIPFIHMGQEIGLSKGLKDNTYNSGDAFNYFNYSLLKDRSFMLDEFKEAVKNRKEIRYFHEVNMNSLDRNGIIYDLENNGILFKIKSRYGKDLNFKDINIFINPSDKTICYNKDNTTIVVPPISIKVEKND